MSHQFNFRISEELYARLKRQAQLEGKTQTELVTTAIECYLEKNSAACSHKVLSSSPGSDLSVSCSDSVPASFPITERLQLPDLNTLWLAQLTMPLEAKFQQSISLLASRIAALEGVLMHQAERNSPSNLTSDNFPHSPPQKDPQRIAVTKEGDSLHGQVENENRSFAADVAPLQQMTQTTEAKPDQPGSPSLSTVSGMRQTKASAKLDSATEQTKNEIPMVEEWFSPQTAYEHAKNKGYQYSFDAFRLATTNKKDPDSFFAQFGLVYDPARRVSRGITSKCFRLIRK